MHALTSVCIFSHGFMDSSCGEGPNRCCEDSPYAVLETQHVIDDSTIELHVNRHHLQFLSELVSSASTDKVDAIEALFDESQLQALPIGNKSKKWPRDPKAANFLHYFYGQLAHILG